MGTISSICLSRENVDRVERTPLALKCFSYSDVQDSLYIDLTVRDIFWAEKKYFKELGTHSGWKSPARNKKFSRGDVLPNGTGAFLDFF